MYPYNKNQHLRSDVDFFNISSKPFVSYYVTFSPSRSVRCETKKPPAMRVRIEGYTKKTPNAIQLRCSSQL